MKKDKYKIQVGDFIYEASKSYRKVFDWEVLEIWIEAYLSGYKTVFKCHNGLWTQEFFSSDVVSFYDSRLAADKALEELIHTN